MIMGNTVKKKILGVVRASTDKQEIESQKNELESYIVSLGYSQAQIEWLEYKGASARKVDEKYLEMLDEIKLRVINLKLDSVAFWHLNRLGRNDGYIISMKNWFIENNIQVYVKNPSLTLLNEDGSVNSGSEIAWGVFAALVKQETDEMRQKMNRGRLRNARENKFNGGKFVLFGYKVGENNYIIPDDEEVRLIRMIYDMYCTGDWSSNGIANELNSRGIRERGILLTGQWVSKVLCEKTYYTGVLVKTGYSKPFEPIVDEGLWLKCKGIRDSRAPHPEGKSYVHIHYGSGILKCGNCGNNFYGSTDNYRCYGVANGRRTGRVICASAVQLRKNIADYILMTVARDNYAEYKRMKGEQANEENRRKYEIMIAKHNNLKEDFDRENEKKSRIAELYESGFYDRKKFNQKIQEVMSGIERIVSAKKALEEEMLRVMKFFTEYRKGGSESTGEIAVAEFDSMDEVAKNRVIHDFIKSAVVKSVKKGEGQCVMVTVTDMNGGVRTFVYYPYRKSGRKVIEV